MLLDFPAQLAESDVLELTDALTSDAETPTDLVQGLLRPAFEAETLLEDRQLPGIEDPQELAQHLVGRGLLEGRIGTLALGVGNDIRESARILVPEGGVQRRGLLGDPLPETHLLHGNLEFLGQLLIGGLATEKLLELMGDPAHPGDLVDQMDRQPDRLGLVGEPRLMDCLIHQEA